MPDNISQANLDLLINIREHIASGEKLRDAFEKLLAVAGGDRNSTTQQSRQQQQKAVRNAD